MKKILSVILALMFVITFVNAQVNVKPTPEEDIYIQIKCEYGYKYCTQDEINHGFKWVSKHLIEQNFRISVNTNQIVDLGNKYSSLDGKLDDTLKYIKDNEAKWSEDKVGGGMSFSSMVHYIKGEFIDYLKTIFASKREIERLENRIDILEAKILNPTADDDYIIQYAGLIKSKRINEPVNVNKYTCFNQHCIKIKGIN